MSRDYPDRPYVGVGAVLWRGESVLLVRRGQAPKQGEWSLPGGAQHLGETVDQAVRREVREETGLAVDSFSFVAVVDGIFPDTEGRIRNHYTLIDFTARCESGQARAADDVVEVRWTPLDQIAELGMWEETVRIIEKSRGLV